MRKFTCISCSNIFESNKFCKSRTPKYCSQKCYKDTIYKKNRKYCKVCNKMIARESTMFCSYFCTGVYKQGKPLSLAHRTKLSAIKKGIRPKHLHNAEVRRKISISLTGRKLPALENEKHYLWKGEKATYTAFHQWIKRKLGKANKCENVNCKYPRTNKNGKILLKPKIFNWALKHGYKHDHNIDAYMQLCCSCHKSYDLNLINI